MSQTVKVVSCGCCSEGCVCVNHQDVPRGLPPRQCNIHCDDQTLADRWVADLLAQEEAEDARMLAEGR